MPAYLAYTSNSYYYGASHIFNSESRIGRDTEAITEAFGESDTYALLVPSGDSATQKDLSNELHHLPEVTSIISYVDTVGQTIPTSYLDKATLARLDSGNYSRMIISVAVGYEGDEVFELIEKVRDIAHKYYGDDYYLADVICSDESDYEIQYERSVNTVIANGVHALRVESNNGGSRVAFEIDKRLKDKGFYCNVTENYTTKNKETKIIVYAPWVKQHIYFKDRSLYSNKDDYGIFITQLLSYTVSGKVPHDDCVDAVAMFAEWQGRPESIPTKIVGSLF